jgi:UDP-glucuronate 4-epimerase
MKKILITGTAGFIGFHLANKLLSEGHHVTGLDEVNAYYEISLKYARLEQAGISKEDVVYGKIARSSVHEKYQFIQLKLEDKEGVDKLFSMEKFEVVINLAAQAGVRYSLTNPEVYIGSNITGFLNILEACRYHPVENLVYASSSSVYGLNTSMPFSVNSNVDHPVSLYAASKKSNELMAHTYSHLFGIPTIGLRFFTVYGPWGRPDMALFIFTKAILEGRPIEVFNHGNMERDFTYVDDIVNGISRMVEKPSSANKNWNSAAPDPSSSKAPYRLYNIGNNNPVKLMNFIDAIEKATGKKAERILKPIQAGDVEKTWADVDALLSDYQYKPDTTVEEGIRRFIIWYRNYYQV